MRKIFDIIAEALLKPVNTVVTVLLGFFTISWGLWVVNPFIDSFDSQAFSALISFMPCEACWGLIAIFAGVMTLLGVWYKQEKTVFLGAESSAVYWFILSIFFFIGDWTSTAWLTASFLFVLATYIYLNCKVRYDLDHSEVE